MTFSLVARCPFTGQLGVGAVTGTAGVGQLLTWARRNVGAAATQSWINPYLGSDAIALLDHGHRVDKVLRAVLSIDEAAELRQLAIVDYEGATAVWTGPECSAWAGHHEGDGYVCAGNLLASEATLDATCGAFEAGREKPLVERLIDALEAGEAEGGDLRGARSASVYVVEHEEYALWDIRIDDHEEPLVELRRVHRRFAEELLPVVRKMPTRRNTLGELSTESDVGRV